MTENSTESSGETPDETSTTTEDATDWKAEARKWEQRAKDNGKAKSDLEKAQRASMSEAERAIAEAEAKGRTTAATQFGERLARTEFKAAAAARNPSFDVSRALDIVNLAKFIGDDGEPDEAAIKAAVADLVPAGEAKPPSFDGGTRQTATPKGGMNDLIRKAAGHG